MRAIHLAQITEHGGEAGIRDGGLLQSALARPLNLFAYSDLRPDLASLAASYAFGIARNHPFLDGNKRTAYVVCRTFLEINGATLTAELEDKYKLFLGLAMGEISENEFAQWLRERITVRKRATPRSKTPSRRTK